MNPMQQRNNAAISEEYVFWQLPAWVANYLATSQPPVATAEARMAWVLNLLERQIAEGSGGPFAAALFVGDDKSPLAVGLNMVERRCCSLAHAEMVALAAAEQVVGSYNLATAGACQLVSSCEPCAMCYGALPWSGITSLLCAARASDAQAIGFDEGARHPQWRQQLEKRGIAVTTGLDQPRARMLMERYAAGGGVIYNAGKVYTHAR